LELCETVPIRTFEPGAILLSEGKKSGLLYVLVDGEVEILKGDFRINIVSDPGAIFGEISALLDIPHMATVRALTKCRAHVVENSKTFLQFDKQIAFDLSRLLAQRLVGVTSYLAEIKTDFEDQKDHIAVIHLALETLVHQQDHNLGVKKRRDKDSS
jgi:CRP-like cAMP-binding protein